MTLPLQMRLSRPALIAFVISLGSTEAYSNPDLADLQVNTGQVIGEYRQLHVGFNVRLILSPEDKYSAEWYGCYGEFGVARGTWTKKGNLIWLDPMYEEGPRTEELRTLELIRHEESWVLISPDDRRFYDRHGLAGCLPFLRHHRIQATTAIPPEPKAVAGDYHRGDELGFNVMLSLHPEGMYSAVWFGCLGDFGKANGTWTLSANTISLEPEHEEGDLRQPLRALEVMRHADDWIFLSPSERNDYERYGVEMCTVFQRVRH